MGLKQDLANIVINDIAADLKNFRSLIDPSWIEDALRATGTMTQRRRRLPAEQVVWLVIGMGMMRDRPVTDIVSALNLSLPDAKHSELAPSAVVGARQRLGEEPIAHLFHRTATTWAHQSAAANRWRGMLLFGVDGTTMRVADSPENRAYFGLVDAGGERGFSGYPVVRVAALMTLRSHLLADVCFGPFKDGETNCAKGLWSSISDNALILLDRAYLTPMLLVPLQRGGVNRHWLTRASKKTKWRVVKRLADGDDIVEMTTSDYARARDRSLPRTWFARAIYYCFKGYEPSWLLTSLNDPELYPREELIRLYHERWELELGFDEIKTVMRGSEFCLRSRTAAGTRQELWGIFLAYNLVRLEMERVARLAGAEPTQLSFATSLRLITDTWLMCSLVPEAALFFFNRLETSLRRIILPPRRPWRAYPRAVKVKLSSYPRKRPPKRPRRPSRTPPSPSLHAPRTHLIHEMRPAGAK
jgi:hypothetical protein